MDFQTSDLKSEVTVTLTFYEGIPGDLRERNREKVINICIMKLHHDHHLKKKQLNHPLSLHVIISALHIDFCGGIRSVNLFITWKAGTPRAFWISYHAISLRLHFRSLPS